MRGWFTIETEPQLSEEWSLIIGFLEKLSNNRSTALSRTPGEIAEALGLPQQKVRAILVEMFHMGIVERRTRGLNRKGYPARSFYRINRNMIR
ncbi:hypothetical protein DMB44_04380 [Thermoplasma sp. Kam2015]|uniref:hypothetical protein n=1 Tax=Thermoplasma sp. Kam2015 TaxID=2094122 RepID=UPI000D85081E|nr:hypothetical protein [Thermoplasma sp. Kam2015]PYB68287.1 hypothetical protein DMB44_04380 [Thermoplasma sp. Kam2015]